MWFYEINCSPRFPCCHYPDLRRSASRRFSLGLSMPTHCTTGILLTLKEHRNQKNQVWLGCNSARNSTQVSQKPRKTSWLVRCMENIEQFWTTQLVVVWVHGNHHLTIQVRGKFNPLNLFPQDQRSSSAVNAGPYILYRSRSRSKEIIVSSDFKGQTRRM
jgi:hypothetical protein